MGKKALIDIEGSFLDAVMVMGSHDQLWWDMKTPKERQLWNILEACWVERDAATGQLYSRVGSKAC